MKDSGLCAEGIRQIRELSPDLVFLDIQMPLQGRQFKVSKTPSIQDSSFGFIDRLCFYP